MAIVLIVMASPPFPWIVDAAFGVTFLSWFIVWNKVPDQPLIKKMRVATMALILLVLLTLSVAEFPHRRIPVLAGQASDHLVVIGDSISSGIAATEPPWPVVLNRLTGIAVRNLSRPGATVADGLAMAQGVSANDRLILIELGGNDLIAGESSDLFARGLDALLARLKAPGRMVVMFELPLLPDRTAYGRIQRTLSSRYGVWLIPKRYLASVLAGRDATSDGLHLTHVGATRMAAVVRGALLPVLKVYPDRPIVPATRP